MPADVPHEDKGGVSHPDGAADASGRYESMPMVGLGGSAGSIQGLLAFFRTMPADSGMVFVVILHLSAEHESTLPALIQRVTPMPTIQVQDSVRVQPNTVYVIPPGKALASADGSLRVSDLQSGRGKRVAVDLFFRTLADTHGPNSAAIVLSGADSDGALGIKRIKERGGLTIAQDPDEAEHSSMPRAAIHTGMVDWVLRVEQMPARLLDYYRIGAEMKLPPEEGPQPAEPPEPKPAEGEAALREVLRFLRTRTARDFTYYKRATILRRISRRMQVNGIDDLPGYLEHLRTNPGEAGALLQDLLISVTNFFRDKEAFDALALQIPELFNAKGPNDCVRAWVPACASGEEAYSIAMLLAEHARTLDAPPAIQVFATDLDEEAIAIARSGLYPFTIATDVSEERLRRFFVMDHRGYRVRQDLRETLLFACHDLLKDSPFSRMDLVSCRNLLIYLNRDAQARAFDIFAFALWPKGMLFLGTSETIDEGSTLFNVVDKKNRIFEHRSSVRPIFPIPSGQVIMARAQQLQDQLRDRPGFASAMIFNRTGGLANPNAAFGEGNAHALGDLHLRLIERLAPPSVVVNRDHEIVHLSDNAGRYLQFGGGELKRNLLDLVNPVLRVELRAALYHAAQSGAAVDIPQLQVEIGGVEEIINIRVRPAADIVPDFLLVIFESARSGDRPGVAPLILRPDAESVTRQLEREMEGLRIQLRETVEQYEGSNEELKASNEELQAMNEELRSATEELETSREELQSINEELTTVNHELKSKVDELGKSNSDLHNLMVSTAIPTIFMDRQLRIMRYTPSTVGIFNLIATDIGRPLMDLEHRLRYPMLEEDARGVLARLTPTEREIADEPGERTFLVRLLPYRTMDEHVGGVVLTLVDITESKRSAAALKLSEAEIAAGESRFRALVSQAKAGIVQMDTARRFTYVNDLFCGITGRKREDLIGQWVRDITVPEDFERTQPLFDRLLATGEPFDVETRFIRPDGTHVWVLKSVASILNEAREVVGISSIVTNIGDQKRIMEELESNRRDLWEALMENEHVRGDLEAAGKAKDQFLAVLSHELRTPLTPVLMATRLLERRKDLAPEARDSLAVIRRNVLIEAQFIDDLLDITRIERGKLEILMEPLDLHGILREAINVAEGELEAKRQKLVVDMQAGKHEVAGDSTRLQQVMWNLLKNASKFSPEESEIHVRTWNEGEIVCIAVADRGIGIEPAALEVIFDPFRQENLEVTRSYGGLGLGLAIANATVQAHGGALRAESAGRYAGATFIVSLPLAGISPQAL
jgi:two-component system CheB/CheR fusion protein